MGKKNKQNKEKKDKTIIIRNIDERRKAIRPVLEKLSELQLSTVFDPIKELMKIIQKYIQEGGCYEINIIFIEINKRIKGFLTDNAKYEIWIKLENI
tara:strand:+ start:462 stop:752 length:291 start_codon:yes stop_codon:yes gene_type:complete